MLGIVVALPWESKSLTNQTIPIGSSRSIADNVIVAVSGIGPDRAHTAAALLVEKGAKALLSWGFAAALDPRLQAGSLIVPKRIIHASGENHPVSGEWHRRLAGHLSAEGVLHTGALAESDRILRTPAEKQELATRTQAIATDMESAALAKLATKHRLPFVALRAILDTHATHIPEKLLNALDAQGEINVAKLLAHIRPYDCLKLVQLCIQFNAAQTTLKNAKKLLLQVRTF